MNRRTRLGGLGKIISPGKLEAISDCQCSLAPHGPPAAAKFRWHLRFGASPIRHPAAPRSPKSTCSTQDQPRAA